MNDIFPPIKRVWLTDADICEAMAPPWEEKSWERDKSKPYDTEGIQGKFMSDGEVVPGSGDGAECLPNRTIQEMDIDIDGENGGAAETQENMASYEVPAKTQHKSTPVEANVCKGPLDSNASDNYGASGVDDMMLDPPAYYGAQETCAGKTIASQNPDTKRQDGPNASRDQSGVGYLSSPAESEDGQTQRALSNTTDQSAEAETTLMNTLPPKSRVNSGVTRNGNGSGTTRDAHMLPYMTNGFRGPLHPLNHSVLTHIAPAHAVPIHNVPTHNGQTRNVPTRNVPIQSAPTYNAPTHNAPTHNAPTHNAYKARPRDAMGVAIALELALGERKRIFDLVCVGFGPASLAIAIAISDKWAKSSKPLPKVLFIERQPAFAWHSGMQVPSAKMQISFLKDLATPRDPTSPFTFLNYLHMKNRLAAFTNLSTFMPSRMEFEDYMQWCASFFGAVVKYHTEVQSVEPETLNEISGKVSAFKVKFRTRNNLDDSVTARHVVIAVGGQPYVPPDLLPFATGSSPRVTHSTDYTSWIKMHNTRNVSSGPLVNIKGVDMRFAVVGGGQSAAEIFYDLWHRYPEAQVWMLFKDSKLRPSDDSPFVNHIFDPQAVDDFYNQDYQAREVAIRQFRPTNYGVIRPELLGSIYEILYDQQVKSLDPLVWRARILPNREVVGGAPIGNDRIALRLSHRTSPGAVPAEKIEEYGFTHAFLATGYTRAGHEDLLRWTRRLLPDGNQGGKIPVARNYRVMYDREKVEEGAGVWLQGCNEATHGLSDTLLSIIAIRGGEIVNSIFGTT